MKNSNKAKSLPAPAVFASYRIMDFPRAGLRFHPWQVTETESVLVNAFDLLANRRTVKFANRWREEKQKLPSAIEFSGFIMLDSGAFNFLRHEEISITPKDVLDVAIELEADICVALDHPFPPKSTKKEIQLRLDRTRKNTEAMFFHLQKQKSLPAGFQIMPVLHGHDRKTLQKSLSDIENIFGEKPKFVGIGSLAPLAQNGSKQKVIDIIRAVRASLPEAHIHCFSMGSALLMLLAFYCGANTVDSQTWIMSAAFKQIQLPGFYLTRFSEREAENNPNYERICRKFAEKLVEICQTENFRVKNWDTCEVWEIKSEKDAFRYLDFLIDRNGKNHLHRRACHNLYTFNFEARACRGKMAESRAALENFIGSRLHSTLYKKVFEYAMKEK